MSQARQICPERIEVQKSASMLDKEINRLRQKIQAEHASHGDREEIMRYVVGSVSSLQCYDRCDQDNVYNLKVSLRHVGICKLVFQMRIINNELFLMKYYITHYRVTF